MSSWYQFVPALPTELPRFVEITGDVNIRNAQISYGAIRVETRNPQLRAGVLDPILREEIQSVSDQVIAPKTKIVDQSRCDHVRVSDRDIAIVHRPVGAAGRAERSAKHGHVLPVIPHKQPHLIADVLI